MKDKVKKSAKIRRKPPIETLKRSSLKKLNKPFLFFLLFSFVCCLFFELIPVALIESAPLLCIAKFANFYQKSLFFFNFTKIFKKQ